MVLIDLSMSTSLLSLYLLVMVSANMFYGMKIMSMLVISMPLCSRHSAAVLDELSCCPSVGVWVSMGGWLDEGHVLLSSGNRWPHRVTSPHDQWRDRHKWVCAVKNSATLINLRRGLQSEPEDFNFYMIFYTLADSLDSQADRCTPRKHFCQCDCPVLWWWLNHQTTLLPRPAVILRQGEMSYNDNIWDSASVWTSEWPFTDSLKSFYAAQSWNVIFFF